MMNPLEMIKMFFSQNKNPKDIVLEMTKNNNNPMIKNLIQMAEKGNTKEVENFARNMFKEHGRDFDAELNDLQKFIGNIK